MPVPPPPPIVPMTAQPLRQRLSNTSLRAFASGTASVVGGSIKNRGRRLSTSTPLLRGTPFLHRRPWFPLSPRTSRLYSTGHPGGNSNGSAGGGSSSGSSGSGKGGSQKAGFGQRLRQALSKTKIEWYPIPIGLGIGFLAFSQFRKAARRPIDEQDHVVVVEEGSESKGNKSRRIRPDGPWQVQVLSTLPLRAFSRAWGWFNSQPLPVFLRTPGFKLYSYMFGVNLSEVSNPDLTSYRNLSEFFYRELKPGARPIDQHPNALVSPADGTVLHFGEVRPGGHVEQVKGMTYPLDALIGAKSIGHEFPTSSASSSRSQSPSTSGTSTPTSEDPLLSQGGVLDPDEEFAVVNGIHYTLPSLLHGTSAENEPPHPLPKTSSQLVDQLTTLPEELKPSSDSPPKDESLPGGASTQDIVSVAKELVEGTTWHTLHPDSKTKLFFCVIYLAPGDYHRYHSPVSWVVQLRRHFTGELFSVSPFLQRTLPNLFTLNERVALLGRWKHGLFTMTPVGATNVGSIIVNFDKELRTNDGWRRGREVNVSEASYANASKVLNGWPVKKGEEMGGFKLGSTVVLVFEAPGGQSDGFKWECKRGGKVKVGERLGMVVE